MSQKSASPKITRISEISEIDKAWLAGFIDGEGYIGVVKSQKSENDQHSASWLFHPWVIVTNTNPKAIKDIQTAIGFGKRAFLRRTEGRDKPAYQIKITKLDDVITLLETIGPYLKLKTKQCKLMIKFCKLRKKAVIITGRGSRGNTSFGKKEENIFIDLKKLNKRGI